MRGIALPVARIRSPSFAGLLRHFGFLCAASLYVSFGALLFVLTATFVAELEARLIYFDIGVVALLVYLLPLIAWISVLPTFANVAAREIRQQT